MEMSASENAPAKCSPPASTDSSTPSARLTFTNCVSAASGSGPGVAVVVAVHHSLYAG